MTNEEAKIHLQSAKLMLLGADCQPVSDLYYAVEKGIEALETIPKYKDAYGKGWIDGAKATYEHLKMCEEEEGGDPVSREAVCEIINDIRDCISVEGYCAILERLKKLPSVNPQQKTGHWINQDEGAFYPIECSECHKEPLLDSYGDYVFSNYCPVCGAKMVEPQESEEISDTNLKMWQEIFKAERSDKE